MRKSIGLFALLLLGIFSTVAGQSKLADGQALLKQGNAKEAIAVLNKVVANTPRNIDAWLALGQAHLEAGQVDSANFAGEKALDLDGKNPEAYVLVAKAAMAQKDNKVAYEMLKKGLKYNKNSVPLLIQLGWFHMETDSADHAVIDFSRAKEVNPRSAAAFEGLGDAYAKMGSAPVAILQYEEAVKVDSLNIGVYQKLSKAYYQQRADLLPLKKSLIHLEKDRK